MGIYNYYMLRDLTFMDRGMFMFRDRHLQFIYHPKQRMLLQKLSAGCSLDPSSVKLLIARRMRLLSLGFIKMRGTFCQRTWENTL